MDEPWWEGRVASDVHCTLREKFASLHFLLVTSVTMVFLHGLLVFVLRPTQPLELFPKQLAQCLEAQPPSGAALGSSEDEHGHGGMHSGHQSGFLSVAGVGEQLGSALHLRLFMKQLSHSEQCRLPGPASSSDVQDLPPACSVTLAIALPCLGFLGTSASAARAHLKRELKLPAFRAHSPLLKSRRFFVDILTLLSSHCQLCPAARHLAVYLLDHFLDRYNITTSKQLYTVAVSCLLLASKFEDREDHVPKLEQINSTRILSSQNFTLTKKELLSTELLLLEAFSWNLCLPTPAHFLDYYLLASVSQKDQHCHSWPTTCPRKTKECLKEYAHYFLEVTLQDHIFYKFQPSVVAAACVGASRICLQLSPYWTRDLQRISNYSLEHLSTCIEILLVAYDNVLKDAVAVKSQALAMVPGTSPAPTQMLFQPPAYPTLGQPTPVALAQFQTPVQDLCLAYRDSLQAHCSGSLLSGGTGSSLHSPYPSLQPLDVCPVPLPASLSMQMAISAEPRHCLATTYRSSYFSGSHAFPTGCFDR